METGIKKTRLRLGGLIFALLLAAELAFVLDMVTTRADGHFPAKALLLIFGLCFLGGLVLSLFHPRLMPWLFWGFTFLVLALGLGLMLIWYSVYRGGVYQDVDESKAQVFADRKVLALVPHQDDETNILLGVLEQYVKYGSDVYVAYVINGDYRVPGVQRIAEAEAAMAQCGIPADRLIFLGYGDWLNINSRSIYFCPDDEVITSNAGFNSTYGTDRHPPFNPNSYTRRHMYEDIRTLLLRYTPDVIFCTDMDSHDDHQAVSMFFEKAMGEVLKARSDYAPEIYRAFAYNTAYWAESDYYALNIASTRKQNPEDYITASGSHVYNWSERLRLPVRADTLSRSLLSSGGYEVLRHYASQDTAERADGIINGDKVFWQRESGSLSYEAEFYVSSGDGSTLNDFVLTDRRQWHEDAGYSDNTWVPEPEDQEKRVIIRFTQPTPLSRVVLYDNPSLRDNVLEASVRLDNGAFYMTGPLEPNGSGTEILFDRAEVEELEICLMETEGRGAGLTEIELFATAYEPPFQFIKLTNTAGDFIYDYYIDPSGREELGLYTFGCSDQLSDYRIICIGEGCHATVEEDRMMMNCPPGKSCLLTLMDESGRISDTVAIRNESTWSVKLAQYLEKHMRKEFRNGKNSNTARAIALAKEYIGEWT